MSEARRLQNLNDAVDELLGQLDAYASNRHHSFVTLQQMAREAATLLRSQSEAIGRLYKSRRAGE